MGWQLNGSQGGGISNSASRVKGDLPFLHEDRRDVTLWRLYVFYCGRMDGGSVSGSRPAVPAGELPAGELPVGMLPWVADLRLREVASFRRGGVGLSHGDFRGLKNNLYFRSLNNCIGKL